MMPMGSRPTESRKDQRNSPGHTSRAGGGNAFSHARFSPQCLPRSTARLTLAAERQSGTTPKACMCCCCPAGLVGAKLKGAPLEGCAFGLGALSCTFPGGRTSSYPGGPLASYALRAQVPVPPHRVFLSLRRLPEPTLPRPSGRRWPQSTERPLLPCDATYE
jgi:hypothetical protein